MTKRQLLGLILDPKARLPDIPLPYAQTVQRGEATRRGDIGWRTVNRAIVARWNLTGLNWIRREARELLERHGKVAD